jgi:hypothetical protein
LCFVRRTVSCCFLGIANAYKGDTARAEQLIEKAANTAPVKGQANLEQDCQRRLREYRGEKPARRYASR